MAKQTLTNAVILLGEHDLSGDYNRITLKASKDVKPCSTFGDTWETNKGTVKRFAISGGGYWDVGTALDPDAAHFGQIDETYVPLTVSHSGATAGDVCYLTQMHQASYECFGSHADIAPFNIEGKTEGIGVRGIILDNAAYTGTADATGQEYVAVAADETLYGVLHVTVADLTTATFEIEHATTLEGAYTSYLTFTAVSDVTYEWKTDATDETDTFWRLSCTAWTGTSASVVCAIGIK